MSTPFDAGEQRRQHFRDRFDATPTHSGRSPGRVNLIGEHTDYNDGFVLPVAIDRAAYVLGKVRDDRQVRVHALTLDESATLDLDTLQPGIVEGWSAYVAGMADYLQRRNYKLVGVDLLIDGDVPQGAGLSSSAALEVAVGSMLLTLAGHAIDRIELAQVGQQTEHNYIHVQSGIMDQMISALGQAQHALLIDCRDYSTEPVPLPPDVQIVVCNSKVKRELAQSGYNERRAQCDEAVSILQTVLPDVRALRDVSSAQLEQYAHLIPPLALKRARHVVTENERVLASRDALRAGDLDTFGKLMQAAHQSYRDDFEASTREIEVLVDAALTVEGVFGSRLTGGGFGGCTVSLVASNAVDQFQHTVASAYERAVGYQPDIYVCKASDGVSVETLEQ